MSNYCASRVDKQQEHTGKKACLYNLFDWDLLLIIAIYLNHYVQEA
jgi:deoxyribodipyrimidine photolyase-like uncharacterized protein